MAKTTTVSARVPVDIGKMVERTCKQRGISKSALIGELLTQAPSKPINKGVGGAILNTKSTMPEEARSVIAAAGGLGVGMLVYNVLDNHLPEEKFSTPQMKKDVATICAITIGLGAVFGIAKLLKGS
jgi:hypothetical protein